MAFPKKFTVLFLSTLLFSVGAFATDHGEAEGKAADPRFTFYGAEAAYAQASPVSAELLAGRWMSIGAANAPGVNNSHEGYFPEGKFKLPGYSGFFRSVATFVMSEDSFGRASIAMTERVTGVESGKEFASAGPFYGSISDSGEAVLSVPRRSNSCASKVECRYITAKRLLLCKMTNLDNRETCKVSRQPVFKYVGHSKLATQP